MISALVFQKYFSIPATSLLIIFLKISSELRNACNITSIPIVQASKKLAKKLKNKGNSDSFDIYKYAHSQMPKLAFSSFNVKLYCFNGHFHYY